MTTNYLKIGVEPTSEMLCVLNILHTLDIEHNFGLTNWPLLQSFRDAYRSIVVI